MSDGPTDHPAARQPGRERWLAHDLRGVHALLVDDNPDARYILGRVLEYCGALVSPCASIKEAIETLTIAWPNVLVTDLTMPDGDGYALLRTVRALETAGRRRIPAVIVTAQPVEDHRARARAAGFSDVLAKPVDFDVLCRLLRTLADAP